MEYEVSVVKPIVRGQELDDPLFVFSPPEVQLRVGVIPFRLSVNEVNVLIAQLSKAVVEAQKGV